MGEWSDFDGDVPPAGGGGDPFSDAQTEDFDTSEAASVGALPGGADGQLTPFSPNGGFDYTDVLQGGFQAVGFLDNARAKSRSAFDWLTSGGGPLPRALSGRVEGLRNFLSKPVPTTDGPGLIPGEQLTQRGANSQKAQLILRAIRMATGMRVTQRHVVNLIIRYGFPAVVGMTQAPQEALLFLFMREKGTVHHHRGPGIYTIAKKMRRHAALMHSVQRILGRGVHRRHRTHKRYNFHKRRKR